MKYALFDKATGAVRQWQDREKFGYPEAPADELLPLADNFQFPAAPRWVVGGKLTDVQPPPPTIPLATVVALKWAAIQAERERRKSGGFLVLVGTAEKWFHSDPASRVQHLGLKDSARDMLAAGGTLATVLQIDAKDVLWKTMDGTWVTITGQIAFDIVKSARSLDAQLHQIAEQHKAKMEASTAPSAYDFSTGWPRAFA